MVAAAIGGAALAGLAGSAISGSAAQSAANTQAGAAQAGINQQNSEFNTVQGLLAPYSAAGKTALTGYQNAQGQYANTVGQMGNSVTQLGNLTGANGNAAQTTAINGLQTSPLYTNAMNQGQQAILANASATGSLRGGNTIASLGYLPGQVMANTMGQQISNMGTSINAQTTLANAQNAAVSQYGGLLQVGENAAAGTGTAAMNTGNNITSLLGTQGAATAGGTIGAANATTGALNSFGTYLGSSGGQSAINAAFGAAGIGNGNTQFGFQSGISPTSSSSSIINGQMLQ